MLELRWTSRSRSISGVCICEIFCDVTILVLLLDVTSDAEKVSIPIGPCFRLSIDSMNAGAIGDIVDSENPLLGAPSSYSLPVVNI